MNGLTWHGKLWCIADAKGKLLLYTLAETRGAAIVAYEKEAWARSIWPHDWPESRRQRKLRCVQFIVDLQEGEQPPAPQTSMEENLRRELLIALHAACVPDAAGKAREIAGTIADHLTEGGPRDG